MPVYCIVLFFGSVFLYSRANDFSSSFHPDEPGKAKQILEHKRTFKHPQLLFETIELALKFSPPTPAANYEGWRRITLVGRWVSVIFAGLAVVAFAMIGYWYGEAAGFWLAAVSVGLCPSLLL